LHRNGHYQGTNFKGTTTADETQVYKRSEAAVILQEKQGTRKHASNRKEIYKQASGKQQLKPLTKVWEQSWIKTTICFPETWAKRRKESRSREGAAECKAKVAGRREDWCGFG
jgi:hypothetical protein